MPYLEHHKAAERALPRKRAPICPGPVLDEAIMDVLSQSDLPLSAYDVADRLRQRGRSIMTASVYRSLARLRVSQQIERVETLSSFRVKDTPKAVIMICSHCGCVQPLAGGILHDAFKDLLAKAGFVADHAAIEATGTCRDCLETDMSG
jgi:Fur family zinc uptake transcriptional regulator